MKKILLTAVLLVLFIALTACSSSEHRHDYAVASEIPATCTENGSIIYQCTGCEHTYTKNIPAGHNWQASDCTVAKTCSKCKATEGEAPGHTYENNVCVRCKSKIALDITLPTASAEAPLLIHNRKNNSDIRSTYEITDIKYELSGTSSKDVTVTIILEGSKTKDADYGDKRYSVGKIAYKICDEDGVVVFSNTKDTMMLVEGEKFKNLKIALTGFNSEQKYVLTFFDYYS